MVKSPKGNIEFAVKRALIQVKSGFFEHPSRYYFMPNQDLNYLSNSYTIMKSLKRDVSDVLFVGGTLYASIIKGYDNTINVESVEIDSRAVISQLFGVYCIKNNGTKKSTLNHLLLDKFVESDRIITGAYYPDSRVSAEFDYFKKFIDGLLSNDDSRLLFDSVFNLKLFRDGYFRQLPSMDTNPNIISSIFDSDLKPDFPDIVHNKPVLSLVQDSKDKYDLILSNNVYELDTANLFFWGAHEMLRKDGLLEITNLMAKSCKNNFFETVKVLGDEAGNAYGIYNMFGNVHPNYLANASHLKGRVNILRKI